VAVADVLEPGSGPWSVCPSHCPLRRERWCGTPRSRISNPIVPRIANCGCPQYFLQHLLTRTTCWRDPIQLRPILFGFAGHGRRPEMRSPADKALSHFVFAAVLKGAREMKEHGTFTFVSEALRPRRYERRSGVRKRRIHSKCPFIHQG
jgi:hypothetical protein